jgi:phage shock protein E
MPRAIDLAEVVRLVDTGAQLVDVLSRKEFEDSHLPGAINIPLTELDEMAVASFDREAAVVAYCFDYE